MKGKIVKIISNDYTVLVNNKLYVCKALGKFRNLKIRPIVGDEVVIDLKKKVITEISPRKNELMRPIIANVDQAIIVVSVKEPPLSLNLLDKLLVIIEDNDILPIICFTKMDLLTSLEQIKIDNYRKYYQKIGYQVYFCNKLDDLKAIFKNKITVLAGQSGVGKSTLLNKLEQRLNLKTAPISKAIGRGKHTTRHVELLPVLGGLIADTPGFSYLSLEELEKSDIRDNFIEFNQYRHHCQYKDCFHHHEQECAIKEKVKEGIILKSRYDNYLKFITKG